jgi:DNA-binding Lrp family transcriptional regulator
MDALDVQILRSMGILPFVYGARGPDAVKPSRVARRLDISTKTAKARLQRLEDEGVIAGYQIYPNLRHMGFEWRSYFFRVPQGKKEGLRPALRAVDGLVGILDFFGPDLCVDLYYRDEPELQRRLRLVAELLGAPRAFEWYENRMPRVAGDLSNLDWRIVKALRMRARTPPPELSKAIGVTARTIRRRLSRMVAGGGIDVVPLINPAFMKDALPSAFLFRLDPDRAQAAIGAIEQTFDLSFLSAWVPPSPEAGHFLALLTAKRMADIDDMRRRAAELYGVESVETFIPTDRWYVEDWIDEALDRKIAETAPVS